MLLGIEDVPFVFDMIRSAAKEEVFNPIGLSVEEQINDFRNFGHFYESRRAQPLTEHHKLAPRHLMASRFRHVMVSTH